MVQVFNGYNSYKEAEIVWLDSVPSDWGGAPVKYNYKVVGGSTPKTDVEQFWDGDVTWITPADLSNLPSKYISTSKRAITEDGLNSCGTSLVPIGSVIISTRAPIGSLAINLSLLCTNQGCKALVQQKNGLDTRFLYYWLSINSASLNVLGRGSTFLEISGDELGSFDMPIPSCLEQEQIANFLDHETAKIDILIDKQQQLIKLLKEKRQAVISHAVTKGLNPDAMMKNSGVAWLGEVPKHWVVALLKYFWAVLDCKHITAEFVDDGIPLASIKEVKSWVVDLSEAKKTTETYYELLIDGNRKPQLGDIIYSRNATVGEAALVPEGVKFAMGQDVCLLKKQTKFNTEYFLHQLNSPFVKLQLESLLIGSTFKRINVEEIRNYLVVNPPIEEQDEIAEFLKSKSNRYDQLIEKAETAIALMQERRTALISAAVTGKIDVRNWQPAQAETIREASA